jgi:hypothetical protein
MAVKIKLISYLEVFRRLDNDIIVSFIFENYLSN